MEPVTVSLEICVMAEGHEDAFERVRDILQGVGLKDSLDDGDDELQPGMYLIDDVV